MKLRWTLICEFKTFSCNLSLQWFATTHQSGKLSWPSLGALQLRRVWPTFGNFRFFPAVSSCQGNGMQHARHAHHASKAHHTRSHQHHNRRHGHRMHHHLHYRHQHMHGGHYYHGGDGGVGHTVIAGEEEEHHIGKYEEITGIAISGEGWDLTQ